MHSNARSIWHYIAPRDTTGGFKKTENWGDPLKINGLLLLTLFALRQYTGWAIYSNNAFAVSGHSVNSQHYKANADDYHFSFNKKEASPKYYTQIKRVITFLGDFQLTDRVGLGIYPTWHNPGFHLDVRGRYARWGWLGIYDENGNPVYDSFKEVFNYVREFDL